VVGKDAAVVPQGKDVNEMDKQTAVNMLYASLRNEKKAPLIAAATLYAAGIPLDAIEAAARAFGDALGLLTAKEDE
jgi:hypothetical protein